MTDTKTTPSVAPWLPVIALAGFWIAVSRILSPQWSVYVQYNYGWAVPFLCAYLLWMRWQDRPAPNACAKHLPLVLLGVFALLLLPTRIIAEANPIWRASSWAMAIQLMGITLCVVYLVGGSSWLRHFGFAALFFLIAIPWPSGLEGAIVQSLMRLNTAVVVEILNLVGVLALPRGNVIEISTGLVGIDEACSGIRSLQATLMMALLMGEYYRLRAKRRIGLVIAGVLLAMGCNVVRTFILVMVCNQSGISALDRWHDPTGIGILLVCFGGLWVIARKLRVVPPTEVSAFRSMPQISNLMPISLLIWLGIVELGTFAWFRTREPANSQTSNWSVHWPTNTPGLREMELSQRVRAEMKFKEGQGKTWSASDGSVWQAYYFRWGPAKNLIERVHVQFAKTHRPEICLPASGLNLRADRGVKDFSVGDLTLPFRAYEFDDRGLPLHVYFCAWEDGTRGTAANMRENAATRIEAALAGSRSVSQRVLEIAVWGYPNPEAADSALKARLQELIGPAE